MKRTHVAALFTAVLVAAALSSRAGAESKYKPCALLTHAELEAALSAKVGGTHERDAIIPRGPYKGETMSTCNWVMGTSTYVTLNVIRGPRTPQERAEGLAGLRAIEDGLKKQGWTIAPGNIPGADCSSYKPPAGKTDLPPGGAACVMVSKGLAFWLGANGSATVQQVKGLADKVAARLP